jgi:N-methylhydantoinase A
MRYRVGIDVGGTFTDFLLVRSDGTIAGDKSPSTPDDFSKGILDGLGRLADQEGLSTEEFVGALDLIVHGTTAVTNALLTRSGAKTGLLTTRGFRDALEMRRGVKERIYDNKDPAPSPLVAREIRIGISERTHSDGQVIQPTVEGEVLQAAEAFRSADVTAVAICFLHSYANEANEQAVRALIQEALPEAFVSMSSQLLPKIGFYDRLSTTVVNAFAGPLLSGYVGRLAERLAEAQFGGTLLVMLSSGGVAEATVAAQTPAGLVGSGPAGAAIAGMRYATVEGHRASVTFDMGGTSLDLACVLNGTVGRVRSADVNRVRVAMPMVDVVSVGAGGGSIARVDPAGLIHVGPESAGADPGPVAYGRGGTEPTVTDANLILGYLDPAGLLGGRVPLDRDAAMAAIAATVAEPLGASVVDAAMAVFEVVNSSMASAVREFLYERGHDPKDFALVAAGGAGPIHAAHVARDLGVPTVIVPRDSALFSAVGLLVANLKHDFVRTAFSPLASMDIPAVLNTYRDLIAEGSRILTSEGVLPDNQRFDLSADLRYERQVHEIEVPISLEMMEAGPDSLAAAFADAHRTAYGYELTGSPVEFINARVSAIGKTPDFWFPEMNPSTADPVAQGRRRIHLPELRAGVTVDVFSSTDLMAGACVVGPALIQSARLSLLIPPRCEAAANQWGDFILRLSQ